MCVGFQHAALRAVSGTHQWSLLHSKARHPAALVTTQPYRASGRGSVPGSGEIPYRRSVGESGTLPDVTLQSATTRAPFYCVGSEDFGLPLCTPMLLALRERDENVRYERGTPRPIRCCSVLILSYFYTLLLLSLWSVLLPFSTSFSTLLFHHHRIVPSQQTPDVICHPGRPHL